METIRLKTCDNIQEANILKGRLENEGIRCFLTNENFTSLFPHYFGILGAGVHIMVHKNDYQRASEILKFPHKSYIRYRQDVCPACGSKNIGFGLGKRKILKIISVVLSVLFIIPFNSISYHRYCRNCGAEFKDN
jgi:hypothetical protein